MKNVSMKKVLMAVAICFTCMLFVSSSALAEKHIAINGVLNIEAMTVHAADAVTGIVPPCDVIGTFVANGVDGNGDAQEGNAANGQTFTSIEMTALGDAINLALLSQYNLAQILLVPVPVYVRLEVTIGALGYNIIITEATIPVPNPIPLAE